MKPRHNTDNKKTSWGREAKWYDSLLETDDDTYQSQVILPNFLRVLRPLPDEVIVELGSGQGFFAREVAQCGSRVIGIEIGKDLVDIAEKRAREEGFSGRNLTFYVGNAEKRQQSLADLSVDALYIILALQNMKDLSSVVKETSRVLKASGRVILVLNHPAFRIPQASDWGFDEKTKQQYRKVYQYLSPGEVTINMHPGQRTKSETVSYHHSLQDYMKVFAKKGLAITRIEEWISHKKSEKGPRQGAEDKSRKEIPMFLCVELKKLASL